ncbi:MAG: hypothetical protein E6R03_11685 [Hyphomicrobiaceae bacterium]|nr:MAG: hypothetical protein E6R03_11685 [Hyphomicrobiaceae bacterium]
MKTAAPEKPALTVEGYFAESVKRGHKVTEQELSNATQLIEKVNALLDEFGERRGQNSGHRTREKSLDLRAKGYAAAIGGTHETANGIDLEDEDSLLKNWLDEGILARYGLYMEHPSATRRWVHLQRVPPRSGRRIFYP